MNAGPSDSLRHSRLDTLVHDIHGCVFVVRMGLEALSGARGDDEQFAELRTLVETDGLKRLEKLVEELTQLARDSSGKSSD